jgi:UDP-N-acetylmuramoyl-L-alanyl-D-glutamate--2,6-diaminopimelate ligase
MNKYNSKGRPITFIDFAHTPEAINEVLISTKKHFINKKIITVFGCGGNRDSLKRKLMGKVVSNNSDKIIITNDNPRNEEPKMIVNDIISGFKDITNHKIIFDRKKAIKKALELKNSENIVLILGKGNEEFQIVKNKKILHSDDKVVKKILKL